MRRRSQRIVRPYQIFGHRCRLESLEARVLLASDVLPAIQNPTVPADVDGDGQIMPLDALAGEAEGEPDDVEIEVALGTFVIYDANDGSLRVQSVNPVTTVEIVSESGIFTGDSGDNLLGVVDIDEDHKIFKLVHEGFTDVSFGAVAVPGLSEEFVLSDLTINGSIAYPDPDDPGEFRGAGISNKLARLRLELTNLSGDPIHQVTTGDDLFLTVLVEDRRGHGLLPSSTQGVFAAYMDVTWDPRIAEAVGEIQFSEDYSQVNDGRITPGLIDEIGAVATSGTGLSQTELELARIRFKVKQAGDLTFSVDPADISPHHDVLLFGESFPALVREIEFVDSTPLTGDLDQNGTHDLLDVELLCALINVGLDNPAFDYDGSGELDAEDMVAYLDRVFSTGPGDSNLDGVFDSSDLVAVFKAGEYEDDLDGNSGWGEGDWNCDGDFDSTDLVRSFAAGGYVGAVRPALREVAAALDSIYADRDSKTALPSVRRVRTTRRDRRSPSPPIAPCAV